MLVFHQMKVRVVMFSFKDWFRVGIISAFGLQFALSQFIKDCQPLNMTCPQMLIKPDFAKYMIDQKAAPVSIFPTGQRSDPQSGCLLSPALPASLTSPISSQLAFLKANFTKQTTTTSQPASLLQLSVHGYPITFNLIFAPALGKFLPPGDQRSGLRAAFASSAQDQFLFLQFESTRVQVRALLLSRAGDLHRLFKESSFFAFSQPPPAVWIPNNLQILPAFTISVPPTVGAELESKLEVTVMERGINPNRIVRKTNYRRISIGLDKGDATLFFHQSSLAAFQLVLKAAPLVSSRTATGILFGLGTEMVVEVEEVNNLGQVSLALLRQEAFIIPISSWVKLAKGGLSVALQERAIFPLANMRQSTPTVFLRS